MLYLNYKKESLLYILHPKARSTMRKKKNMSEKEIFDTLSDEFKAKLMECTTEEELMRILADAGLELDQDTLKAVVGGLIPTENRQSKCPDYNPGIQICRVDFPPFCPPNGK